MILQIKGTKSFIIRKVTIDEALAFAKKESLCYFEMSAKTGDNMKNMIYNSIYELPFFDQYRLKDEDIIGELELENNGAEKNGNNLSILDSSRGTIQINRSEIKTKGNNCKC